MPVTETRVRIVADNKTKETFRKVKNDIKKTTTATQKLRKATTILAAAYVALRGIGVVVNQWREFGATMADLSAITGATGKDLEFLKQKSLEFGAQTTLTASQAAEAFKLIASAKPDLLESGEALAAVTKQAIILAEASGSTLPDAANTLAVALNQYGAGADEAGRFINVLAAGAKRGASEIADTAEAIKVAGLVAAGTNTSFEEMNAAIQVMSTVALKGSDAGTGLRNIYLNLANQTESKFKPAVVGLTQAIMNLKDAQLDDVKMMEIFGKRNIVAAKALINNADAMGRMREQLTGTTTAYDQAATKVNNLDGDMKKMGSQWESVALMMGETFDPALRGIIQLFTMMGKVAKTVILTFKDLGNAFGALASQAVALAKLDFSGIQAIREQRLKYVAGLEEEYNLIWDINGAQTKLNETVKKQTDGERLEKIKAQLAAEQQAREEASSAAFIKEFNTQHDALVAQHADRFFTLQESLLNETQSLQLALDNRSFIVEDAFQDGLISDQRRNEILLQLQAKFEEDKTKLAKKGADDRNAIGARSLQAAGRIFSGLSALMSSNGAKQTKASQDLARASIIANTAGAIMSALNVQPYPLGVALAAGAALEGAAQLQAVGGSGGSIQQPSSLSGGGGGATPPPATTGGGDGGSPRGQTVINIYGAITKDMIRDDVIPVIQNELNDNDLLLYTSNARQAGVNK